METIGTVWTTARWVVSEPLPAFLWLDPTRCMTYHVWLYPEVSKGPGNGVLGFGILAL